MDRVGQQLLACARFAQQQHRAAGLSRPSGLALERHHGRTGTNEAGKTVPRLAQTQSRTPLNRQGVAGFVQFALHQGKLGQERLQI